MHIEKNCSNVVGPEQKRRVFLHMQFGLENIYSLLCRFFKPNSVGDYSCVKGLVKIQAEGIFVDDALYMSGVL